MFSIPYPATILFLLFSAPLTSSLTTDGLTLLALRSAVSHDPTRVLSSWSESDPSPCSWMGVTCSPRGLVTALSLPSLSLSGYLPSELSLLSSLQTLDISNNSFSNRLPNEIGNLAALSRLDLSSNSFNGSLPVAIAGLPDLSGVLNLSFNLFTGEIPAEYGRLPVSVSLDVRYNNLSGEIPQVGSLVNQGPTAFAGNPNLCGFPLKNSCNPNPDPSSEPNVVEPSSGAAAVVGPVGTGKKKGGPMVTVTVLVGVIFVAFVSVLVLQLQFRKRCGGEEGEEKGLGKGKGGEVSVAEERREGRTGEIYVTVDEGFGLELEELLRASAYVVGKSKSGIVYKVVVGRGLAVAVRRLSEAEEGEGEGDEWKKRRAFESEAMSIGRAIHPNVVRLRAYYYAPDEKLLIYDYIPNGILHSALHGGFPTSQPLPWATRLAIIQGAARGLTYLHECSPRKYIHGNIKSSKILLDDDFNPYISGFGLTRLQSGTQKFTHSLSKKPVATMITTAAAAASYEYLAPEARVPGTLITQKCDVYAFGVVMLEVLTGRVTGRKSENGQHVEEVEVIVRSAFKEERPLSEVIDPALLHEVHAKKQVLAVFHVALGCTELDPEMRPRMRAISENLDQVGSSN